VNGYTNKEPMPTIDFVNGFEINNLDENSRKLGLIKD